MKVVPEGAFVSASLTAALLGLPAPRMVYECPHCKKRRVLGIDQAHKGCYHPEESQKSFEMEPLFITAPKVNPPREFYEMEYGVWEEIVKTFYGLDDYNVAAEEETGNDTTLSLSARRVYGVNEYDQEQLDGLWEGKVPQFQTGLILHDLVNRGVLPEGNYLINISW